MRKESFRLMLQDINFLHIKSKCDKHFPLTFGNIQLRDSYNSKSLKYFIFANSIIMSA